MEEEPVELIARWTLSLGILYLILEGQIPGSIGVGSVAWIITFDIEKFIRAYKSANYQQ